MHGRKWIPLTATALALTLGACSPNSLMKPDCHSCTVEEQEWKEFSWASLEGKWKGSVESFRNERDQAKKTKVEKPVELSFGPATKFLQERGTCASLPETAMVLNGILWEQGKLEVAREYEAFVPAEDGKVAYGRVTFSKLNGKDHCQFRRLGRVMGKNRLSLPSVSFSDRAAQFAGRSLASTAPHQEISLEFLRYSTIDKAPAFAAGGRKPASARDQERPTLMFRVFKVATTTGGVKGEWSATEEHIYRLWRAE
jgi:hypothetical protein